MMKTVAVLCFENPFNKPSDGAKNDMKTRILALSSIKNCCIDVYAFNKPEENEAQINNAEYGIRNYFQYKVRNATPQSIVSRYPLSVYKRYSKDCAAELKKHEYDVIIYEGEHMSSYRLNGDTNAKRHVIRQHDIESNYRHELAKSAKGLHRKIAQELEARKYEKLERNIDTYFDTFLFISKDEKEVFDDIFIDTKERFKFMPPSALHFSEKAALGEKEHSILYFGNMELQNNFLSILWFTQNVFPTILNTVPDTKLRIIGRIADEDKEKLIQGTNHVEILGYVEDLNREIQEASFIAAPVLYGAGVKVKVIDALSYGQIVCATSKTVEGTELLDGVHLIVRDDPVELSKTCIDILCNREKYEHLAVEGLQFVKSYHSIEYQATILQEEIQ